jgi:hypothetical protein
MGMDATNDISNHQGERKHILVVNGDPAFLEMVRELLQLYDYNVTTTNFVPRTFRQIEARRPDLVIIDLVIGQTPRPRHGNPLLRLDASCLGSTRPDGHKRDVIGTDNELVTLLARRRRPGHADAGTP